MPWTAGSTTANNIVRLHVGDISTSTGSELLPDAAYTTFNSQASSIWIAAQLAANALAARAASSDSAGVTKREVGDLKITYSGGLEDAGTYRALASKFGRMAAAGVSPYAGGISVSDKSSVEDDTDRIKPMFKRGLFDSNQTLDPASASELST